MYFCIRDDDTSYFTSPDDLENAYGEITRWGPVSLAVVPFHCAGTSKAVPEKFRGRWSVHPLHENTDLVHYLRDGVVAGRAVLEMTTVDRHESGSTQALEQVGRVGARPVLTVLRRGVHESAPSSCTAAALVREADSISPRLLASFLRA